jgi:esterase/lipase superfamily enzyme
MTYAKRSYVWAGLALLLIGCGSRGELAFAPEAASVGSVETVIVSTTRAPNDGLPLYTSERILEPEFARFAVSVPPEREVGTVTYPRQSPPNPETDFLVVSAGRLPNENAFVDAINSALAADPTGSREGAIFVHGYNTNFAEGLYLQAQLQHDMGRHGASVHFAWPSAARLQGYVYDRESVLVSRDGLESTLDALASSKVEQFNLFAHSMGTMLVMDTLKTMARGGHEEVFAKLNAVVLVSPDIEIDVFRTQAPPVLARGVPIYVLVSRNDRALELSARLRGERDRVGSIRSAAELDGLDVTVVDLSSVNPADLTGHFREARSPALIDFVQGLHASGTEVFNQGKQPGLIEGSLAVVQEGTSILTTPIAPTPVAQ